MKISKEEIQHIAKLAKIHVNEEDLSLLKNDLSNILDMMQKLNQADCNGIEPLAHPLEQRDTLTRDDEVTATNTRTLLQKNAPAVESGLYLVPQVIE